VAEEDRPIPLAGEEALFALLRLRREAVDVGERRAVADEDAVQLGLLRQRVEPIDELRAEGLARRRQSRREEFLDALRDFWSLEQPAFHVAANANPGR
jgi:hypothetical protein